MSLHSPRHDVRDPALPPRGSALLWSVIGPWSYWMMVRLRATRRHRRALRRARWEPGARMMPDGGATVRLDVLVRAIADCHLDHGESADLAVVERERRRLLRSTETVGWAGGGRASAAWICARASLPPAEARCLYAMVRAWRPTSVLELGTCLGVSAACIAAAQRRNGGGRVVSIECYPDLAHRAGRFWADLGLTDVEFRVGRFDAVLTDALALGPYDMVFLDGDHAGTATLRYVDQITAAAAGEVLLVLDDIDYSSGMRRAWRALRVHPCVAASADLGRSGLLFVGPQVPNGETMNQDAELGPSGVTCPGQLA